MYSSCDENDYLAFGNGTFTFTAPATQDYYILIYGNNAANSWVVSQVANNFVCENAEDIAPGETVASPQGARWYKLAATKGRSYGVDGYGINGYFDVCSSCNGSAVAFGSGVVAFTAPATQDYYLCAYGYDAINRWSVSEITANDNRICANATPVSLNAKVPVGYTERWYCATVQAGKWYSVSAASPSSSVEVYASCGGERIASGSGTTYFRPVGNATVSILYSNSYRYDATAPDTLIIRESPTINVANTTCAAAQSITIGQPVVLTPAVLGGASYYYKLAVEAGKSYEIPPADAPYSVWGYISKACSEESYLAYGYLNWNNIMFSAETSGEYVIAMRTFSSYSDSVSWQVNEVAAPISCAVAEAVSADATVHTRGLTSSAELWYKFTPESGKTYRITSTSDYDLWVLDGCNGPDLGAVGRSSRDSLVFTAPSGSDCYILWYAPYWGAPYEFDWRISEFTPPIAANTTCATAEQAEVNASISAVLTAGREHWYALEVTEGAYYSISKGSPGMRVALYTNCQSATPAVTDEGEDDPSVPDYHAGQTGTAYIKVTGAGYKTFHVGEVRSGEMCEAATPIAPGKSVAVARATTRWYSLEAEPGYLYTISNSSSGSYSVAAYDGCGGAALGEAYGDQLSFSVSSAKTCYICYNSYGGAQEWSVSRSLPEGNTICSTAEPARLNTPTTTAVEAGKTYWYVFSGEAGKVYEISSCGGASFDTELRYGSSCEELSSQDGGCNGWMQERLIAPGEGKPVYFGWKAYYSTESGSVTWTVTETPADNRLCAYAEPVRAGDTVQSIVSYSTLRWYQLTAQAGKAYEIFGAGSSANSATLYLLSGTCDSFSVVATASDTSSMLFLPEQTAAYYIACAGVSSSASDYAWSWEVVEVTGNSLCANATTVAANATAANTHTGGSPLWHAFTAPKAGQYDVTAPAGQLLKVWSSCESSKEGAPVAAGSGSVAFTASANATYYLQWAASASYAYSYTWSLGLHDPAALTALSVLNYPLSPAFSPQTDAYQVNVPHSETSVTLAADAQGGATVTGAGNKPVEVGNNTLTVTVAAAGSSKTYTVAVRRAAASAGSDATLSALTVSAGSLTPSFGANTTSYALSVGNAASSITIAATATDAAALVSGAGTYPLSVGSGNIFPITVVAEDGRAQRAYSIAVTRAAPEVVEQPEVLTVTVTPSAVAGIEAGHTQLFTANVATVGGAAQTVTWSVAGSTSASTAISASGLLAVGSDETAPTLTVTATSTDNTAKRGTATVAVAVPAPEVLSVSVAPNPVDVQQGATQRFTASVAATGGASQEVTWSVSGSSSSGTGISADGLLSVAADETTDTLTVTATSVFDSTKSGTGTVTVTAPPETGVEELLTAAITLYPNPFADVLHLSGAEGCTLRVISSSGATLYRRSIASPSETISLENLPAGLYFLRFEKNGKAKTLQAVKING